MPRAKAKFRFLYSSGLLLLLPFLAFSQAGHYFENPVIYDANKGINVGLITDVEVDNNGFLWIAGNKGLQRFDGFYFKGYTHNPDDSLSLLENNIRDLFYDEENNKLWISTWESGGGLSVLDLTTEKFTNYAYDPTKTEGITGNTLIWTYKDKFENYWISVASKGLVKYLPESDTFKPYFYELLPNESALNINVINRFNAYSQDVYNDSLIWIGSGNGLLKFNVVTEEFIRYPLVFNPELGIEIREVLHHHDNHVYVGTWKEGVFRLDQKTGQFTKCIHEAGFEKSGSSTNRIYKLAPKSKNQLWITTRSGLLEYDVLQEKVVKTKLNDIPNNKIYGVYHQDKKGRIMVWNKDNLFIYDRMRQQIKPYRFEPKGEAFYFIVRRILEDSLSGKLWIAPQISKGLYQLDLTTESWEVFPPPKGFFAKKTYFNCWDVLKTYDGQILVLEENAIYRLFKKEKKLKLWEFQPSFKAAGYKRMIEDTNRNIWIASHHEGVFKINRSEKTIRQYKNELTGPDKPSPGAAWDLQEDRNGNIWIRCSGYSVYDVQRDTIYNFPYFFPDKKIVYHIESLGIDGEGNVLVASHERSIGITDADHPEKGVVQYFDKSKGLKTANPYRFLLDDDKSIWITNNSLERINEDKSASQFYHSSYLLEEAMESISQLSDGRIAVGFKKGIGIYNPDSLSVNRDFVHPYIHSFKVFDKELETETPLFQTSDVYLEPNQNFFSLEISAINPAYFGGIEFLYQLEGVDPDWVNPEGRSYVAYTDVGSGTYNFKLKAKNNEGIWNENPYELRIHIAAPWYQTWWAFSIAGLLFFAFALSFYRFQLSRKLAHQEANRLKELDTFKTRFYANITHEFRTPLTVIEGMANELESNPEKAPEKSLALIKKNSKNLLALVNQMLDLSKLQAGKVAKDLRQDDIILFIKYLVETNESYANLKNIGLQFYSEEQELWTDFDAQKLEQILTNLISNAVKFTPKYGKVLVVAKKIKRDNQNWLELLVKDNGIGISPKQLPYIFERFHQANPTHANQGTGIGLALVKELVTILNGTIRLESELNIGTKVILHFPIQNKAPKATQASSYPFKQLVHESNLPNNEQPAVANELPILLIIEDNEDVTYYLKTYLEDSYHILTSRNGKEGIEKAMEELPDIIISDVMMPEMDGFEVCKILKEDERTSHIPIILLTAKATSEDKLIGLTHGADAYLIKPFEKEELIVRLNKLLEIRKILQKKYSSTLISSQMDNATASKEDTFIEKVEKIILTNLEDEHFSINELSRELHLSRSQVYRKIKALTGMSAVLYIRHIRLQKAKELLVSSELSISEIAFQVGFKTPVYFSQAFKEVFGKPPSAIRK